MFETNPWNCLAYAGHGANPALCKRRNVEQVPLSLLLWEQVPLAFPSLFLQAASWEPGPGCSCLFFLNSQLPYRTVECLCACKQCLLQLADLQQPAGLLPGSLHPQRCQGHLFMARWGKNIKLAGDGRCDSAGHCAKYGRYTLMDAETSEVLHTEFVQVRFCCCVI